MGQYYEVIAGNGDGTKTVYDRHVDGEYTGAKLMEHSWKGNSFCRALCSTLVDNPRQIAWVGDYAEDDECTKLGFEYWEVWGREDMDPAVGIDSTDFELDNVKYLINEDKQEYVDLAKYKEASSDDGYVIHPLPILTCLGNGRGGGDYCPRDTALEKYVGDWCWNWIYLSNILPEGYKEICPVFKEGR